MLSKSIKEFFPLKIVRLDSTNAVKQFDCGDKDLNDFILN